MPHPPPRSTASFYLCGRVNVPRDTPTNADWWIGWTLSSLGRSTVRHDDFGSHNTSNWSRAEPIQRVACLVFRPGIPDPLSADPTSPGDPRFDQPDYHEVFPRLDLDARCIIDTQDEAIRAAYVQAARAGFTSLRQLNASPRRR
jgi:hypothetical protein